MDYTFEEQTDIKLIILCILDFFNIPVSNAMITDTALSHQLVNYFDMQQYLLELTDNSLVTYYNEDGVNYYSITSKGKETLSFFIDRIPATVRERLLATTKAKIKEIKHSQSVVAKCEKINDLEYNVTLSILEAGYNLLTISVAIGDKNMADDICRNFEKNPQAVYGEVLATIIKSNP